MDSKGIIGHNEDMDIREDRENNPFKEHNVHKRSPHAELVPLSDQSNVGVKRPRSNENGDAELSFGEDFDFSLGELDHLEALGMKRIDAEVDTLSLDILRRCRVTDIDTGPPRKLRLEEWDDKEKKTSCLVLDEWADSEVCVGDIVSVRAVRGADGSWQVRGDRWECRLVVQPDLLLSCTSLTMGLRCRRRAVLAEWLRGMPGSDKAGAMTLGSVLHEVAQNCMLLGRHGETGVRKTLDEILDQGRMRQQLCAFGLSREDLEKLAEPYVPSIAKFLDTHATGKVTPSCVGASSWDGRIAKVLDIEDTLWVPQLGLKGKVDILGVVTKGPLYPPKTMPLELKTGKCSDDVAHRAQVVLYSGMLAELEHQSTQPPPPGVVIYLKEHTALEAQELPGEMRDGIIMRNEIVRFSSASPKLEQGEDGTPSLQPPSLPPVVNKPRDCTFCPYTQVCAAFLSREDVDIESLDKRLPQLELLQDQDTYPQAHLDFFLRWMSLVQLEQGACPEPLTHLWTSKPRVREGRGERCLADLEVVTSSADLKAGGHVLTLRRAGSNSRTLKTAALNPGDLVVLGHLKRLVVSFATVTEVSDSTLQLFCDRDVTRQFGKQGYHLDAYQSTRGNISALGSLAQLLSNTPEALRLRQLVIDRQTPCFEPVSKSWETASQLLDEEFSLNEDQRAAIQRVFQSRDYVLIQGLPGTGKTATLVALVVALTAQGLSVLVTSHTNAAVDNLLRRVKDRGIGMLRLGSRCHPELQQYGEEKLRDQAQTPEHLQALFDATLVVGVTCTTAAQHWVLRRRRFDVCLIDEATQVPLPATVAPLLSAKRFVLVGDPRQLQPVVVNYRAKELGMGETMFERLQSCSEAIATLGLQYRMNRVLCELANNLTYDGLLRCASEEVANATLKLTSKVPGATLAKFPWLVRALSCEMEHSALFLDVGRSCTEDPEGTSKREASIVKALVHFLLQCGVPGDQVGVMSPFRAQAQLLQSMLGLRPGLEVSTVDQFQGRDKLVAVLSCVKSFPEEQQEPKERDGILNDPKRLTVAVTRSRVKLLIVGDAQSLSGAYDPCKRLLKALGPKRVITLRLS